MIFLIGDKKKRDELLDEMKELAKASTNLESRSKEL